MLIPVRETCNLFMTTHFLFVALGGAVGAALRYAAYTAVPTSKQVLATFLVNLSGCFIIGILWGLMQQNRLQQKEWLLLATGICGGFTTFSAFGLETLQMIQNGQWTTALLYAGGSVVLGLACTWLGLRLMN
jgi:fluoride exporter